jgi:hypothetical protein
MEVPSPARLYAAAAGALLFVLGIVGFFYTASFGGPGEVSEALGVFPVNGWLNLLYVVSGALGLLLAGGSSRGFALAAGALYAGLAIWGWSLAPGEAILGFIPAGGGNEALHLALGLLGLAAAAGTPREPARARRSEARAKIAGQRP